MNPRELQAMIFKRSRPMVRPLCILDGGKYSKDAGILWAAYQAGSFAFAQGMSQAEFMTAIDGAMNGFGSVWIIDDDTRVYSGGRGPVGLVGSNSIDLIVEPQFTFFKWATCRNILKSTVAFLHKMRRSASTGIILIRVNSEKRGIADHMKKYGMLYFVGKSGENEYLYSGRGRGSAE